MAIEGDLKDIGLGIIVQMICMERLKGGLVIKRQDEEGAIYFDKGEIVHAYLGDMGGVEAIYRLLTWDRGHFIMTDKVVMPAQTIHVNWNHLLMDGMRMVDEGSSQKILDQLDRSATEAEIERDNQMETDLIHFISKLEQFMYRLREPKIKKKPFLALSILASILNESVDFCEVHPVQDKGLCSLLKAFEEILPNFPQARILHVVNNRVSEQTALNLYKNWADDPADRRHFVRQICRGLIAVVEVFLRKFESSFKTHSVRSEWRETYQIFLGELRRNMERVPF